MRDRIAEIQHNYAHDLPAFALYARTDARLAFQIVAKLNLVPLAFARSTLTGMTPDRVAASIASFDFLYLSELERLKMSLRDNFVTPWVKANGFGDVDMARLAKSIDQIALTYDFKNRPKAEDIFTSQYLPPAAERKL